MLLAPSNARAARSKQCASVASSAERSRSASRRTCLPGAEEESSAGAARRTSREAKGSRAGRTLPRPPPPAEREEQSLL